MPLTSDATLNKLIEGFEKLQEEHKHLGAQDTEPDGHFHWVISQAVQGRRINWGSLDWELYGDMPGADAAAQALTKQAQKVYAYIEVQGRLRDLDALREYCWRVTF
jgi:hypothetical protein